MISIVDPETLQNVLRPTVYLPFGERNDRPPGSRDSVGDETTNGMQPPDESARSFLKMPFTGEQLVHTINTLIDSEPATADRH